MGEGGNEFNENQSTPEVSPTESSKSFLKKAKNSASQALQLIENKTGLTKAGLIFMGAFDSAAVTFGSMAIAEGDIIKTLGIASSAMGANYLILGGSKRFFPRRHDQSRDDRGRFVKKAEQ